MRTSGGVVVSVCILVGAIVACGKLAPTTSSQQSALMVASPGSADFGLVEINTTSGAATFTIAPSGDFSQDTISAVTGCGTEFVVQAPGAAGAEVFRRCATGGDGYGSTCSQFEEQTFTFTVRFRPTVAGLRSCNVRVTGTTNVTIPVRGTGKLPDFAIDVRPGVMLDFGDVRTGTPSDPQPITITNIGAMALSVSVTETDAANGFTFGGVPDGPHQLATGSFETIQVRCTPPTTGLVTGTLRIASNDPRTPVVDVALTCRGVTSSFNISPTSATFAPTRVLEPTDRLLTITNVGGASGTLVSVELEATASPQVSILSAPSNLQIAPGGTQAATVVLRFAPSAELDGALGNLIVNFAGEAPRLVSIRGTALLADVDSEPSAIDFGLVCMGKTTEPRPVGVFAVGMGVFDIEAVNTPEFGFAITPDAAVTLPVRPEPARRTEIPFEVTVTPTQLGSINSKAIIYSDAPGDEGMHAIALKAFALAEGVNASPQRQDFGSQHINRPTYQRKLQVANCGDGPLMVTSAEFTGPDRDDFNLTAAFEPSEVAIADRLDLFVQMTASSVGTKQAQLVLQTSAGPLSFELAGIGNVDGDEGRETYYACGAARGAGGMMSLLIVAGVLVLGRRRRR